MDPDALQAIAIESLKARYFRSLETRDWSIFSSGLTDDSLDKAAIATNRVRQRPKHLSRLVLAIIRH